MTDDAMTNGTTQAQDSHVAEPVHDDLDMATSDRRGLAALRDNFRRKVITGLLVLTPIGFTFIVLRFLFRQTSGLLRPAVERLAWELPDGLVAAVSLLLLVLLVYLVGEIASNIFGRRIIALGEALIERVPVAKTVYSGIKQVVDTVSLTDQKGFKAAVWIEFPHPGLLTIGFVTGRIVDAAGRPYYKIFVPTIPNPMSGFFQLAPCDEVVETSIDVDDALKMLVSGGILAPTELRVPSRTNDSKPA